MLKIIFFFIFQFTNLKMFHNPKSTAISLKFGGGTTSSLGLSLAISWWLNSHDVSTFVSCSCVIEFSLYTHTPASCSLAQWSFVSFLSVSFLLNSRDVSIFFLFFRLVFEIGIMRTKPELNFKIESNWTKLKFLRSV